MESIFKLEAQVLGVHRTALYAPDATGYVLRLGNEMKSASSLSEAIRLARDYIGSFLHQGTRPGSTWGLLVEAGGAAAVYGDWPLLHLTNAPQTDRSSLVARIRDQGDGD